jgi:hypothetical protein
LVQRNKSTACRSHLPMCFGTENSQRKVVVNTGMLQSF